jgi:DNA-binding response OmpR family regulator
MPQDFNPMNLIFVTHSAGTDVANVDPMRLLARVARMHSSAHINKPALGEGRPSDLMRVAGRSDTPLVFWDFGGSTLPWRKKASKPHSSSVPDRIQIRGVNWLDDRRTEKVLIVDWSPDMLPALREAFSDSPFEIVEANTIAEARDRLRNHVVDLMICDADGSSDTTGVEFAEECRRCLELEHISIILLRDSKSRISMLDCLRSGANDAVVKLPSLCAEVYQRAANLLEDRRRLWLSFAVALESKTSPSVAWRFDAAGLDVHDRNDIVKIQAQIRTGLSKPLFRVSQLVEALGWSERKLQRRCNELFGAKPSVVLRTPRLAEARNKILQGTDPRQAAHESGFTPDSDFSLYFTELFGITPDDLYARVAG